MRVRADNPPNLLHVTRGKMYDAKPIAQGLVQIVNDDGKAVWIKVDNPEHWTVFKGPVGV